MRNLPSVVRRDREVSQQDGELHALRSAIAGLRQQNSELASTLEEHERAITTAQREIARLDDLATASYRQSLRQHVRVFRAEDKLKTPGKSAALQLPHKLRTLEFAASHGIGIPEVYDIWPDISSIDLTTLPKTFVLKADGGAGSAAVFPLERIDDASYRAIGSDGVYSEDELKEHIRSLSRGARKPYFAEELLHAADGGPIPNDVKCYMFYGQVGHILVRHVAEHNVAASIRLKFVDENGEDYGPVAVGRRHDPSITVPSSLPELITVARHVSRAVGLPFCRVDLYDTSRGIVLGEITRAPSGGNERFVERHDELLGKRWIQGSARLNADMSVGRPVGQLFGMAADLRLYPPSASPRAPANFGRTVRECSEWCFADDPGRR